MSAEVDPNQEFREFVRCVQELALRAYPNPQRIGCLSPDVIHDVASQPLPADHPAFQNHIVRCSPCIAAVIGERTRIHRRKVMVRDIYRAAGLILVVGTTFTTYLLVHGAWRTEHSHENRNDGYADSKRRPTVGDLSSPSSPQPSTSLLLRPGMTRGAKHSDGDYELAIPPTVSVASLLLLLRYDTYPQYDVVIETANGQQVWRQVGLRPSRIAKADPTIAVQLPVRLLHNDSYAIRLFGKREGSQQLVDVYSFHVRN